MIRPERTMLILVILALASLIGACDANGEETGRLRAPVDLAGTKWELTSSGGRSLIQDTYITLYFEEGFLGGSMTCNGYGGGPDSGRYSAEDDGTLNVARPLAVILQLCSSPEGIMEQEEAYIEALQNAAAYRVTDNRLEIANASKKATLAFEHQD